MQRYFFLSAFALALVISSHCSAVVLVGWETWQSGSEPPTEVRRGATGSSMEMGDWRENVEAASDDLSFGTIAGANPPGGNLTGTYIGQTSEGGSYDFTITAGTDALELEAFHFDSRRKRNQAPNEWMVEVISGDITIDTLGSGTLGAVVGGPGPSDHEDFDLDMTGLADNVLDPGQSATIRLSFSGGNPFNSDQRTYLDNVAITGDIASTEPTSLPGDFNGDGTVDGADYALYADSIGGDESTFATDTGTGDMMVNMDDYDLWRSNFGETSGGGSLNGGGAPVPEPATAILALAGIGVLLYTRSRATNK